MIRTINLKPVKNYFQKKLVEDINNMKLFGSLLNFVTKTTTLYEIQHK